MEPSTDSHFERGDALEEQGRLEQAFEAFTAGAHAGDVHCMIRLAALYGNGEGVDRCDLDKAIQWEQRAAEAGTVTALFSLGISYRLKGDLLQARACFEKAMVAGDNSAALQLAKLYIVSPRETEIVRYYLGRVLADDSLCEAEWEEAESLLARL